MKLLAPLGLLALISLIILLIIYIIRPNYQQRIISSTFIWKLSLKYKKKRVPISKLRNILLIICQVLILTACAAILAQPNKVLLAKESVEEALIIIDSSASMYIETDGETRYQRSLLDAKDLAQDVFSREGKVSLIIADETPEFVVGSRLTYESSNSLYNEIDRLIDEPNSCSYGTSNIDAALALCEDIITINDSAGIFVYSDYKYLNYDKRITYYDEAIEGEWNVAILDAYTDYRDNYYTFVVEVACYGRNFYDAQVKLAVKSPNEQAGEKVFIQTVDLEPDEEYKIIFRHLVQGNDDDDEEESPTPEPSENTIIVELSDGIFSFESVHISIFDDAVNETFYDDNFYPDNEFFIYGGIKNPLKVQYASLKPNPFVNGALLSVRKGYEENYNLTVDTKRYANEAAISGYDFYIFEHTVVPTTLPTDGVVMFISPEENVAGTGVRVDTRGIELPISGLPLSVTTPHPITNNIAAENIAITKIFRTTDYDETLYQCLLVCEDIPVLLVTNNTQTKVVYLNIDLHYSTLPILPDMSLLFYNIFEYFFPPMVTQNAYEVNEEISLVSRGYPILVAGGIDYKNTFNVFPASLKLSIPGAYNLTQETFGIDEYGNPKVLQEEIYVRIPRAESNTQTEIGNMHNPYEEGTAKDAFEDLLLYVAIALTALMFAEWLLQVRDNM